MKTDPISVHERSLIIRHLARYGNWRAKRRGAKVRLARFETLWGTRIQYWVVIRHKSFAGPASTVYEAVEEVNQIIRGRDVRERLAS
jgi:hypothetical protein